MDLQLGSDSNSTENDNSYSKPRIAEQETEPDLQNNGVLCAKCASLDIAAFVAATKATEIHTPIRVCHIRNEHLQPNKISCPLCHIIIWMLETVPVLIPSNDLELVMYLGYRSTTPLDPFIPFRTNYVLLKLDSKEYSTYRILNNKTGRIAEIMSTNSLDFNLKIGRIQKGGIKVSGVHGYIDYRLIEDRISTCTGLPTHSEICRPPRRKLNWPSKLIDCQALTVVEAQPSYNYVALSYVWGQQEHDPSKGLYDSPATIRDAIEVTKRLRQRYLWVDRYCIDQSRSAEKHAEIEQMGLIYNRAALTIIAVAGLDPNYGLPGVSKIRKNAIPRRATSEWTIVGIPDSFRRIITQSTWATRGWTYQEVLLSRRRLYFTDQEAYFECRNYNVGESWFDYENMGLNDALFTLNPVQDHPYEIFEYISDYSRRKLTYSHDYLNGFLGILGCLAEEKYPVLHLYGVPIPPAEYSTQKYTLVLGSLTDRLMNGMAWKVTKGKRRQNTDFPSWSWVGWSGPVDWASGDVLLLLASSKNEVWVEDETKTLLPLESLGKRQGLSARDYNFARVIHIKAEVFEVILNSPRSFGANIRTSPTDRNVTWRSRDGEDVDACAEIFQDDDISEDIITDPAQGILHEAEKLKALVLGLYEDDNNICAWVCKLLRSNPDGYEVVGQMEFQLPSSHIRSAKESEEKPTKSSLPNMVLERIRLV
ncbi:HET-domain-containing protein [Daldinia loculata]|uniref:HET-domain-containing protein n=1 Tax=Daldinia loculata TaxID=103429 RepID=UPI0020C31E7F|nr:HET-domain-containing protein [Daldinia loculata]KAI1651786.1 HET-domain-containing protein [Daldinia loculata]